ncbi:MerR family transcriptional regulator [Streptomyces sp. Vc74B-19]|uniref:MerR family transcriptional regulator n=1 Tax=unclassified Streptomyces TaxID=2593676 RepID=UPI001BFC354F|nr:MULTISPECIES: MerR family transcriptional regulator [unclassified Streptomyces]MBT3166230.1 MerR family transcriptional regulator [Streptomyces sp. Vc74B-19]MCO4696565.1 MerR family transcriptional regulator [Streptomyces sp. RO-S4]MDU0301774.1 MerR family transcriptional regulator [Streptomyces sp. PAL114]
MTERLTIGEFSRITHLSIRTLRRYHEQDLLVPAEVDPVTGYRYYAPAQVRPAQTVRRFRDLDLPLADLRRFLAAEEEADRGDGADRDTARQVVAAHLRRLEDRLGRTQRAVEALRELLDPGAERTVTLEVLPPQRVYAVSLDVPEGAGLDWYDAAMRDLDAAAGHRPVLPPGGRYAHELFTEGHGHATVYLPAEAPLPPDAPDTVRELLLPGRTAAVATHQGPHDDLDLTYGAVGSYAARHGLRSRDLVEEVYLVGPRDTDQPERWRTLVAWLTAPDGD